MGTKPELIYRTTIQPDTPEPPKLAPPPHRELEPAPDAPLHAAIAEFVCTREQNLKKQLQSEDGLIRDRLALLQRELATLRILGEQERTLNARATAADQVERDQLRREIAQNLREHDDGLISRLALLQSEVATMRQLAGQERALNARAIDADQVERESLRREIALLRERIELDRGLKALQSEVATARADIPKLPAIVSQLQAETTVAREEADRKVTALERELVATKKRLNRSRVDQSVMSHNLAELQRAQTAAAKTEIVEIETNTTRFTMKLNPEAANTMRQFAQSCLDSDEVWIGPPAGSA
jgi:hypothetical protein